VYPTVHGGEGVAPSSPTVHQPWKKNLSCAARPDWRKAPWGRFQMSRTARGIGALRVSDHALAQAKQPPNRVVISPPTAKGRRACRHGTAQNRRRRSPPPGWNVAYPPADDRPSTSEPSNKPMPSSSRMRRSLKECDALAPIRHVSFVSRQKS